jgi:hypothetical protein
MSTYTPHVFDAFTSGTSPATLSLNRVDGALGVDSTGVSDHCYGVTLVSKGPETANVDTDSQLRSVTVIQVGAASTYSDIEDSVNHRLALFATGSAISYAKQKRSLIMTQPAYQNTQAQSLPDSYITFGGVNALKVASVANEFQMQKFAGGAVMSTYRGNAAVEVVAPAVSTTSSWGAGTDWSETTGGQDFVSIKGWDTASETDFIGEKSWVAAFDYHYYDGSHVTLNLGRYGTTSIGSSDEGRYATEELYYAQSADKASQTGSKWGMLDGGKWPSISIDQGSGATERLTDSKTWYAADDGVSRDVSYGGAGNQIALSGLVINDAIRQAGIPVIDETTILGCITPLSCYADLQLGDSYSFPVGNSFNFNNHAANMGIHVGPSATFNIWSSDPNDWDLSGSDEKPPNWALLEKTLGDTYSFHWGGSRSFAETSDGQNSIREGQGTAIEKLQSKRTIFNAKDVTESATVGFNSEHETRMFDFSNSSIGEKYISSAAEYGLNMDISTGHGLKAEVNVSGVNFAFKAPPPEAAAGQVTWDIQAGIVGIGEKVTMAAATTSLTVCLAYVEESVAAAKQDEKASANEEDVTLSPQISTMVGAVNEVAEEVLAEAVVTQTNSALLKLDSGTEANAGAVNAATGGVQINAGAEVVAA